MKIIVCFAVSALALGCGASPDEAAGDSSEEALSSHAPSPYALQAAGIYENGDTRAGALTSIDLHPDGTYAAVWNSGFHQSGRYTAAASRVNPLPLTMRSGSHSWAAQVNVITGALSSGSATLQVRGGVMSEGACDTTAGSWTDDDADVATGLYCVCPAPKVLIWSAGGCVTKHTKTP